MRPKTSALFLALATLALTASAENITGTIIVKKTLTKHRVTPVISVYQRGPGVELGQDTQSDPLAFERSRVIIWLEGPATADEAPSGASIPQIEQIDRRFAPDILVIQAGSTVSFPNRDPIFHNIFSLSRSKSFDLGSYDKGQTRKVVFPKPGIIDVYCHLHPNMQATIVVTPNRWYARADGSGQYHISGVPPGQYTIVAWHKYAGYFRKTISVAPGHNGIADFFIPLEADAK